MAKKPNPSGSKPASNAKTGSADKASSKGADKPIRKRRRASSSTATEAGVPARDTRFRPGQSGNPKGRPRKDRSLLKLIQAELDAEMQVTESGKTTRLSKREALAKSMVHAALKGDHRAVMALLKLLPPEKGDGAEDHAVVSLNAVLRLFARKGQAEAAGEAEDDDPEGTADGDDQ